MTDFTVADLKGESVLKQPGSINGESFVLKNLEDCSISLLDYTSEVEVTNCVNCKIFIGPVDGPAIFDGCTGCEVAVACQQFQAKNCSDCDVGLYCATQPSINSCGSMRFSCWVGAYAGLTAHFSAANLDPKANNWSKVFDHSTEDGAGPNFELVEAAAPWEVTGQEGDAPPDNPVPRQALGSAPPAAPAGEADPFAEESFTGNGAAGGGDFFSGGENGGVAMDAYVTPEIPEEEHPKAAAMREAQRERLKRQEELETRGKLEARAAAAAYLDAFYERRNASKGARLRENREKDMGPVTQVGEGSSWERVVSLIDFGFARPGGADLARYKGVLYAAKSRGVVKAE